MHNEITVRRIGAHCVATAYGASGEPVVEATALTEDAAIAKLVRELVMYEPEFARVQRRDV